MIGIGMLSVQLLVLSDVVQWTNNAAIRTVCFPEYTGTLSVRTVQQPGLTRCANT